MSETTTELHVPQTAHIQPEPTPEPSPHEREVDPHADMLEKIAARYEETTRARELAFGKEQEAAVEDEAAAAAQEAPAEERAPEETAPLQDHPGGASEPAPARPEASPLRAVDLGNGNVVHVSDEQFTQLARMGALANIALSQQSRQPSAPQPPLSPPQQPKAPVLDSERSRSIARQISYGNEEEGARAIQELADEIAAAAAQPRIDAGQIAAFARDQALAQIRYQNDLAAIGNEFPDIFNDTTLSQLAALKLHEIRGRDVATRAPARSDLDAYREACNLVRTAIGGPQPRPGIETATVAVQAAPSQRLERKRAAPQQPTAVRRSSSLESPPQTFPSPSEIVRQMRVQRGYEPM